VRSAVPLAHIKNSLWQNPALDAKRFQAIGYLHGVLWQEKYVESKQHLAFQQASKMYKSFENKKIKYVLSSDYSLHLMRREGELSFIPVKQETIMTKKVYHYVHKDYAAFMKAFSNYIQKHEPFVEIKGNE